MRKPPGFIALVAVLILSAIALVVGTGVAVRAVGDSQAQSEMERAARAQMAAAYCAEMALETLKANPGYGGNQTLSSNGDACRILSVGGSGNNNRTVQTTSTVEGIGRALTIMVSDINPVMKISSWQESGGL